MRFELHTVAPEGLEGPGRWFLVGAGSVVVQIETGSVAIPTLRGADELGLDPAGAHFLGFVDGEPCWAIGLSDDHVLPDGHRAEVLYLLHSQVGDEMWAMAGRAVQVVEWDRTHRFCGRCGTATEASSLTGERARRCPSCGLLSFPRLAPAVITLIERDDEVLLARGRQFPVPMYSCLAGFVEPGETLEQAVTREVREEVGVEVTDIRYHSSQPWPFPHSLMLGFTARWTSGDIVIDESEIVDAGWYRADAMPPFPPGLSIANRLITEWLDRAAQRSRSSS